MRRAAAHAPLIWAFLASLADHADGQYTVTAAGQVNWRVDISRRELQLNSGTSPSSECSAADGTACAADGSMGEAITSGLSYNSRTGKFAGSLVTNGCNDHPRIYNEEYFAGAERQSTSCEAQAIPTRRKRSAIPPLGRIAMTLSGGVNIYSPFEAGLNDCASCPSGSPGQPRPPCPCVCRGSSCVGGLDVHTCHELLYHTCAGSLKETAFMDTCGGHAQPYHIHTDPLCNYGESDTGHSTIVGVALDGRGIYGKFESSDKRPCDLDVCRGHVGPVPADSTYGINAGDVYHYHIGDDAGYPGTWTLGCYGDPDSKVTVAECKAFSNKCDDGDNVTVTTALYPDGISVDLYCPCFEPPIPDECQSASSPTLPSTPSPPPSSASSPPLSPPPAAPPSPPSSPSPTPPAQSLSPAPPTSPESPCHCVYVVAFNVTLSR